MTAMVGPSKLWAGYLERQGSGGEVSLKKPITHCGSPHDALASDVRSRSEVV